MVAAYRDPDRTGGKSKMQKLIDTLSAAVLAALVEVRTLGRTTWLSERDETWRTAVEVIARAGFTGFKTAAVEELNDDVTVVMDAFHVVRLAGHGLEQCRRRIQLQTRGHRGRAGEPLYSARRALSTGADLLTDKQRQRITDLFANDAHLEVETTWGVYQAMIGAYRDPSRTSGKAKMQHLIDTLASGVPAALTEVRTLGRTLKKTGRRHLGLLRPARHQQRTHRGDQCTPEIPLWFCPRVPQPHQLHRQVTAGNRWVQTRTTPSIAMSRLTVRISPDTELNCW